MYEIVFVIPDLHAEQQLQARKAITHIGVGGPQRHPEERALSMLRRGIGIRAIQPGLQDVSFVAGRCLTRLGRDLVLGTLA